MEESAYPQHLHRLQEEQDKALRDTHERIQQWHKFRSDYEALSTRLKTLPDKVTHEVMVPFGKMGFMPGQLVHTNEIMVLLGDNWFAERSARQAREIVDRRIAAIDEQLGDLEKQHKLLLPRQEFTSELLDLATEAGEMREIREEYDEEKEKQRKVERQRRAEEYKQKRQADNGKRITEKGKSEVQQRSEVKADVRSTAGDKEIPLGLWERLNELERQETERRELQKVGTAADVHREELRLVEDDGATSSDEVSSYSTSEELDSDDYEPGEVPQGGPVIKFSHSTTQIKQSTDSNSPALVQAPSVSNAVHIATPADIYAQFHKPGPTSILKKPEQLEKKSEVRKKSSGKKVRKPVVGFDMDSDEEGKTPPRAAQRVQRQPLHPAFTGSVVEKSELSAPDPAQMAAAAAQKPVSKFKSQSANQNLQSSNVANQSIQSIESLTFDEKAANQNSDNTRPVSRFKARRQNLQQK